MKTLPKATETVAKVVLFLVSGTHLFRVHSRFYEGRWLHYSL